MKYLRNIWYKESEQSKKLIREVQVWVEYTGKTGEENAEMVWGCRKDEGRKVG